MWILGLFAFFMTVDCSPAFPSESDTVTGDTQSYRNADNFVYIPFAIDDLIPENSREQILASLTYYENKTCLRFKEENLDNTTDVISKQNSIILFVNSRGGFAIELCKGPLAYDEINKILISPVCINQYNPQTYDSLTRVKQHIYNALGFVPENLRPDRDNYVTVLWDNIFIYVMDFFNEKASYVYNGFEKIFSKKSIEEISRFPYDFHSISHYCPTDYGVNGKTTLISKDEKSPIRCNTELSPSDIEKINIAYCNAQFGNRELGVESNFNKQNGL